MGTRREGREKAVQFLFQYDLNPAEDLDQALDLFWQTQQIVALSDKERRSLLESGADVPAPTAQQAAVRLFADPLIKGVVANQPKIDESIRQHVKNWELRRIAAVDRNVLRLAIYEMLFRDDIPPVVSINEAVDIAKKFSTEESGKFVNGILDKIRGELMRPARLVK
jgi:N utilization substance protein B